jgi:hypothetical protein
MRSLIKSSFIPKIECQPSIPSVEIPAKHTDHPFKNSPSQDKLCPPPPCTGRSVGPNTSFWRVVYRTRYVGCRVRSGSSRHTETGRGRQRRRRRQAHRPWQHGKTTCLWREKRGNVGCGTCTHVGSGIAGLFCLRALLLWDVLAVSSQVFDRAFRRFLGVIFIFGGAILFVG